VAASLGIGAETFRKVFARFVGTTPKRFQMERRIEAAKMLLQSGERTLASIAEDLGYSDEFHFSRSFRSAVGASLSAFRALRRGSGA
jgi:AraC-like DNA-binding protein